MDKYNVRTQRGKEADDAAAVHCKSLKDIKKSDPDAEIILKAQVHAGGRVQGPLQRTRASRRRSNFDKGQAR